MHMATLAVYKSVFSYIKLMKMDNSQRRSATDNKHRQRMCYRYLFLYTLSYL